ncbi:MAG: outer membrane protein assembly factor, partial [Pseudomonadota bacterium]|nr:outer membrane protein assembly factor [Pseudomonadota bacterium]
MSLPVGRRGAVCGAAVFLLAVTAPAAYAQVAAPPGVSTPGNSATGAPDETQLDPNAPLAPLPNLGVDWPDLAKAPAEPVDPSATLELVGETRYSYAVSGIDAVESPLLRQRFDELSTLKQHSNAPANAAQLDRRATEDVELLTGLLRGEGYY